MPAIRRIQNDSNISRADRLLGIDSGGGDATRNFLLADLSLFLKDEFSDTTANDWAVIKSGDSFRQAVIRDDTSTLAVGSRDPQIDPNLAAYITSPTQVTFGSMLRTPLIPDFAVNGSSAVLVHNGTGENTIVTVNGYNSSTGVLDFTGDLPTALEVNSGPTADGSLIVLFLSDPGVLVQGDLTVTGNIIGGGSLFSDGFIDRNDGSQIGIWTGTEVEYQTLLSNGDVVDTILYFRT